MTFDDLVYYGFPIVILLLLFSYTRRQGTVMAMYRQGQELQRAGHELARESIRVQAEANELMRELTAALRERRVE